MPKSVYDALNMDGLKSTGLVLQLADKSSRHPLGVIEDVLVTVKGLTFPADFYVLDTDSRKATDYTIILGRPFLRTANVNISMKDGRITMDNGHESITLTMYRETDEFSVLGTQSICTSEEQLGNKTDLEKLINLELSKTKDQYKRTDDLEDLGLSLLFNGEERNLLTPKATTKFLPKKHKAAWQPVHEHKNKNKNTASCCNIDKFTGEEKGIKRKARIPASICSCDRLGIDAKCLRIEEWFQDENAICKSATAHTYIDFIGIDEVLNPTHKKKKLEDMDQPNEPPLNTAGITKAGTLKDKNKLYRLIMRDYCHRTEKHKTHRVRIRKRIKYRPRIKLKYLKTRKEVRNPIRATLFSNEHGNPCGQRISAIRRMGGYIIKIRNETFRPP